MKVWCSFLIGNGSWDWICWRLMWWESEFDGMDLALSSARASQKALCVMKLSLLMKDNVACQV